MTKARNRKFSSFTRIAGGWADGILQNETSGVAVDFADGSMRIKDPVTPVNSRTTRDPFSVLTFNRASNAMQHDSAGLLCWGPHNVAKYSEDFSNAVWGLNGSTVSADAIASPTGTLTADKIVENGLNAIHFIGQGNIVKSTSSANYTGSMYFKDAGRHVSFTVCNNAVASGVRVLFNPATGVLGSPVAYGSNFTAVSASVTNVGGGWYRVFLTCTEDGTNSVMGIGFHLSDGATTSYLGDSTSGAYAWGAQLRQLPCVSDEYYATTASAYYGPRIDYDPTTLVKKGLLLEEGKINLLLYSDDFSNAAWTKIGSTAGTQAALNPMGGVSWKLTEDTNTSSHGVRQTITKAASAIAYTFSCWVQGTGRSVIELVAWDEIGNGVTVRFTVSGSGSVLLASQLTGDFTTNTAGDKIVAYPNGWYRVSFNFTTNTATTLAMYIRTFNGTTSYLGDGASGFRIFGAQLEAGLTGPFYPTSYIPTVAATVTRSIDPSLVLASTQFDLSPTAATLHGVGYLGASNTGLPNVRLAQLDNNGETERLFIAIGTANGVVVSTSASVTQYTSTPAATTTSRTKVTVSATDSDYASSVNNAAVITQTSGLFPVSPTHLHFGVHSGTVAGAIWIERVLYLPRAASDALVLSL